MIAGKAHLYWRIAQLAHGYQRDFPRVDTFRRLQTAAFEAERRTFEIDAAVHEAGQLARTGRLVEAAAAYEKAGTLGAPADVYRELAAIYAKLGQSEDRARALAVYEARRK